MVRLRRMWYRPVHMVSFRRYWYCYTKHRLRYVYGINSLTPKLWQGWHYFSLRNLLRSFDNNWVLNTWFFDGIIWWDWTNKYSDDWLGQFIVNIRFYYDFHAILNWHKLCETDSLRKRRVFYKSTIHCHVYIRRSLRFNRC